MKLSLTIMLGNEAIAAPTPVHAARRSQIITRANDLREKRAVVEVLPMAPPGTDFDVSFWGDVQAGAQAAQGLWACCMLIARPHAICSHLQACGRVGKARFSDLSAQDIVRLGSGRLAVCKYSHEDCGSYSVGILEGIVAALL